MTAVEYDRALASGLDGMSARTFRAYSAICREARRIGWPIAYRDDLFRHDRASLAAENPTHFAWAIHPCGTRLFLPVDPEEVQRADRIFPRDHTSNPAAWVRSVRTVYGCAVSQNNGNPAYKPSHPSARWYCWNGLYLLPCTAAEAEWFVQHGATEHERGTAECQDPAFPLCHDTEGRLPLTQIWLPPDPDPYAGRPPYNPRRNDLPVDLSAKCGCPTFYPAV